jgi:hypothetical protein
MEVNSILTKNSQTFAPFVSNIIFGTGQGKRPQKFAINTLEAGDSGMTMQKKSRQEPNKSCYWSILFCLG